jgi:xanthine dehydrogenase YagS FAD-binding subunit
VPPAGARSTYLKVRDRASYEFALASVAAVLLVADGVIHDVRLALGGVATIPWRARTAEAALLGSPATPAAFQAAAEAAVHGAVPRRDNAFKVELAKRSVMRALLLCMRTSEPIGAPR